MSSPSIGRHLLPFLTDSRNSRTMAICLILAIYLTTFILVQSDESPTALDDASSLPMLASGKRQHNIMRFGKRPSVEKREDPRHRFLFMGKREDDSLLHFLQGDDNSYKRGHTIMRFGKRRIPQETHNFMRFGRREGEKNPGHSMMYFGKRAADGHNMMYFGKRAGHSMMYFGKRENDNDPGLYLEPENEEKRAAHSMIHFGKREDSEGASVIPEDEENEEIQYEDPSDKRNHNLLRFGKDGSRGSHAMIHFGKRSVTGNQSSVERDEWDESPDAAAYISEPEKNVFLRFG